MSTEAHATLVITREMRRHLEHEVRHVSHILPGQGPIETFVHHNTLHGLQHRPFEEAVAEGKALLGGRCYLPAEEFRRHHARGRITDQDIEAALDERSSDADLTVVQAGERPITASEIRRVALVHGVPPLDPTRLEWLIDEEDATRRLRPDLPASARERLLSGALRELGAGLDRIGVDWTLSDWVHATLGMDLPEIVRSEVRAERAGASAGEAARWLAKLDIPPSRHAGYLRCIEREGVVHPHVHALWLRAEARHATRIFLQRFDVGYRFAALSRRLTEDIEVYATQSLWSASLSAFGLDDPSGTGVPGSTEAPDTAGERAEALLDQLAEVEQRGGSPIPLDAELRERVEALVKESLRRAAEDAPGGGGKPGAAPIHGELERLCATILNELEPTRLHRRGFDALRALISIGDRTPEHASLEEALLREDPRARMLEDAQRRVEEHLHELGSSRSHRDFLLAITGEDINDHVHPHLTRACAAFLDEGVSAFPMPGRALGFYDAWRAMAAHLAARATDDPPGLADALRALPPLATDAVIHTLHQLGISEDRWPLYLQRLLLQLPGWSGMVRFRQEHPSYPPQQAHPIDLLQYLAVRLFYEGLAIRRLCRRTWNLDGDIDGLRSYFRRHAPELLVRLELFQGELPELLANRARALVDPPQRDEGTDEASWMALAEVICMARAGARPARSRDSVCRNAWRLFRLAQLLGVTGGELSSLSRDEAARLIAALDAFPPAAHGPVWQHAYELHYRNEVLGALACRRRHTPGPPRRGLPKAQLVFCIDDREESLRRHIEELDPGYQTAGVAGFFGVAMYYRGLDQRALTPLCPIVVTPTHEIAEVARRDARRALQTHVRRRRGRDTAREVSREALRSVLSSYLLIDLIGYLALLPLVGKILAPRLIAQLTRWTSRLLLPEVPTEIAIDRGSAGSAGLARAEPPSADQAEAASGLRQGFTLGEQADRVAATLRNLGLTRDFAPLVVLLGHGSVSQNNPHLSAYDCGACGGKHGGPNARAFAAMANRPRVRDALRERGIDIPEATWFVGAEHNTADDSITYFDTKDVPPPFAEALQRVAADLATACAWSAHERCRRFASAPRAPTPGQALRHVIGRSVDWSQARPELGHVTNACCVVGRRALTQGVFLDRRAFLVSYDPTQDPEGKILEGLLLAVGPVGAGINLEYYFSTVDNAVYGCGTKVPHNVSGLIGVMEGTQGDLRTGLPRQMIEIHEPIRLLLIVEAKPEILAAIYGRQPSLRELLGNSWILLAAIDPDSGETSLFHPRGEFVPWTGPVPELPVVGASPDWYRGKTDFLAPALISRRHAPERSSLTDRATARPEVTHA